ncbi:MAG: hypothetical protein R3E01_11150 [Pirellulaceae bacterium]|nr:hypothetical protein [Planctomycetales bacterium]
MSSDFVDTGFQPEPPPTKKSMWPTCLIGCGVTGFLGLLICGGVIFYVTRNASQLMASGARMIVVSAVNQSELPEQEKQAIIAQVDRLHNAFQSGEIDQADLERAFNELADSPLISLAVVEAVRAKYLDSSGLEADEKTQAERTLKRVCRGVMDNSIDINDVETALEPIANRREDGGLNLKQHVTDEELREFLAECRRLADDANVPDEDIEFSISAEVKRIVDVALQGDGSDAGSGAAGGLEIELPGESEWDPAPADANSEN